MNSRNTRLKLVALINFFTRNQFNSYRDVEVSHVVKMVWNPLHFKSKEKLKSLERKMLLGLQMTISIIRLFWSDLKNYLKSLEDWGIMPDSKAFICRLRLSRKKPICWESFFWKSGRKDVVCRPLSTQREEVIKDFSFIQSALMHTKAIRNPDLHIHRQLPIFHFSVITHEKGERQSRFASRAYSTNASHLSGNDMGKSSTQRDSRISRASCSESILAGMKC